MTLVGLISRQNTQPLQPTRRRPHHLRAHLCDGKGSVLGNALCMEVLAEAALRLAAFKPHCGAGLADGDTGRNRAGGGGSGMPARQRWQPRLAES